MSKTAQKLATLNPGQFVTLEGFPSGRQSKWHVNNAPTVEGGGTTTVTLVLQAASGDEQWMLAKVEAAPDEEWSIESLAFFDGHPPRGEIDEHADEIPPEQVTVTDIADA